MGRHYGEVVEGEQIGREDGRIDSHEGAESGERGFSISRVAARVLEWDGYHIVEGYCEVIRWLTDSTHLGLCDMIGRTCRSASPQEAKFESRWLFAALDVEQSGYARLRLSSSKVSVHLVVSKSR